MRRPLLALAFCLAPVPALAEACGPRLIVEFREGAPKDRFTLINASDPGWSVASVVLDLGRSNGKLIFDVTDRGAGVSVFQPYEEAGGKATIAGRSSVTDGDSILSLAFSRFVPGDRYVFTIDLDDTVGSAPTIVSGGEIDGGTVRVTFTDTAGQTVEKAAIFDAGSEADTGRLEACFVS